MSGGGSRNDIVAQIIADIFNLPVYKTITTESTTIGAAMAGFLAEGDVFHSNQDAVDSMVHYRKTFMPDKRNAKLYDQIYKQVYLKLYPKLNKLYEELDDLSKKERSIGADGKRAK